MKKIMMAFIGLFLGVSFVAEGKQASNLTEQMQKSSQTTNNHSAKPIMLKLSWSDIETLSEQLVKPLKGTQWAGILAITRGGLIPAGLLAQSLDIRRIETINVQSYDQKKSRGELTVLNVPGVENAGENWLVVDDLVDSGETIKAIRKHFPKAVYAVLIGKPKGLMTVDHHVQEVEQNIWVVFPWENE